MMKKIPNISQSVAELESLVRNQKDLARRQRLKALLLLKSNKVNTRSEVADKLEVHRHAVARWLNAYEQGGIKQLITIHKNGRKSGQRTIPKNAYDALKAKLESKEGFGTYYEIQDWLKKKHKVDIKYPTLHTIVYYELKAKPKVARPCNIKKR
jgi:transposase